MPRTIPNEMTISMRLTFVKIMFQKQEGKFVAPALLLSGGGK
jgi:hypothetical protein